MFDAQVNGQFEFGVGASDGEFTLNGAPVELDLQQSDAITFHVLYEGKSYNLFLEEINKEEKMVVLRVNGKKAEVKLSSDLDRLLGWCARWAHRWWGTSSLKPGFRPGSRSGGVCWGFCRRD